MRNGRSAPEAAIPDAATIEHVTGHLAPRVTVTLPGGRVTEGRLHARRRDADGRWQYQVTVELPSGLVHPIAGEDYSQVVTDRAGATGWVLQTFPAGHAVVHEAGCWVPSGHLGAASREQAADLIARGRAEPCDVCKPEP
ncbi:hypothetical protein GA0115259_110513 [Streptomyces sp. MnatMP-M17]|nr:hypothetical protein GA0115259_110513 [Streptomyces sp. MnatMP-M17]